jgi:dihydropteroate synthase
MESTPERSPRSAALRAAAEHNYTAQRVLRALEVIVLSPSTAPAVAAAIGVTPRTARRILKSLASEQYAERRRASGRQVHDYQPTVRLLAMAAQLAPRLPLVAAGRRAVPEVEMHTNLAAYVAVPCYADVLVSGLRGVRPWATLPAGDDAAGRVLLAHREPWRRSLAGVEPDVVPSDEEVATVLSRGFASVVTGGTRSGSLAVVVPAAEAPIAAIAVRGTSVELRAQTLLAHTPGFAQLGHPLLVAVSNKIFLGRLLGLEIDERTTATAAACAYAVARGARVMRVHDVRAGRQVADLLAALLAEARSDIH